MSGNEEAQDGAPFGLGALLPAFDRASRVARALFRCLDASVILTDGVGVWRTSGDRTFAPTCAPFAEVVREAGGAVWVPDLQTDPRVRVKSRRGFRFAAAAPIRLASGEMQGVLTVCDPSIREPDEGLLALLQDLADGLADECDRLRAIQAEKAVEDVLNSFIETIPVAVVMTDREQRVLRASPRWASFFGEDAESVTGRSIYEISPGMLRFKESHDRCLAGERIENPRLRIEQDGKAIYLRTDVIPWRDKDGQVGGMLISTQNITDIVEAMDQVERSERRLKIAIQLADLHVWEMDYRRRTLDKVGEDSFFETPLTFEDVERDFFCSIHPDDRALAAESLKKRQEGNIEDRLVVRANRSDGKEVWMSSAAELVRGADGRLERMVGVFQNITKMKQAERTLMEAKEAAEAANRSKSEFLANMSHEIRTPLNGVLGMAQVIEADELSDVQRERVKVVRESGTALLAILNDLLDLSKIQAGKLELSPADFDMSELAPVVAAAFEGAAASKDIDLVLEIDDSAKGVFHGDVLRLRQVLSNLVSNALKFTSQGEVALSVRRAGDEVLFRVSDTGIGIASDKIPLLFEKFAQEDASTTRRYGGTGLGLSICRELVELMGGRIEVESRKGAGSVFTAIVPLKRGLKSATAGVVERKPSAPVTQRALRILAAEDNPTNQLVLRSLLAPLGAHVVIAPDGRAAVEAFRSGGFDIVLMDVQMPEMNGVEATTAIRRIEAEEGRARTPILALSANVMTHQTSEYLQAGMDGCIAKPIEVQKLYHALEEALAPEIDGPASAAGAA